MSSTALVATAPAPLALSNGGLIAGKLNVRLGKVELTASELRVRTISRVYQMFGLIGMLLGRRAKGTLALTIDLGRVRTVARGKHGLNKKILDVTVDDGQTHRVIVDDFDRFGAALRDQLARQGAAAWQVA
ncbi:MAG: hypothetical protein IPL61_07005 [Myxococcales bacterium]|nr:hypothetical protein [Myxococcales bacterium]